MAIDYLAQYDLDPNIQLPYYDFIFERLQKEMLKQVDRYGDSEHFFSEERRQAMKDYKPILETIPV